MIPRMVHRSKGCLLSGVKRTSACALHMSAFDPKRTWGGPLTSVI